MNITIQSIDNVNFQPAFVGIVANLIGTIPYFHIQGNLMVPKNDLKLMIWAYPHKINHINKFEDTYKFYPCWGEARQEYYISTFEHPERVPDDTAVGVFLPIQEEYDEMDNNDTLGHIIGEVIEYFPSIEPYFDDTHRISEFTYKDMPPFIYNNSGFFLQVGDLKIPLGVKNNIKVGEKYKVTCTIFTKYGQYPQYDGCLSIDGMITKIGMSLEELKHDGIDSETFYKKFFDYFKAIADIK